MESKNQHVKKGKIAWSICYWKIMIPQFVFHVPNFLPIFVFCHILRRALPFPKTEKTGMLGIIGELSNQQHYVARECCSNVSHIKKMKDNLLLYIQLDGE
jgi:hypothetical protein